MKLLLHRWKFAGLIAALSLMLGACATTPPEQLQEARSTYQQAQQSNAAAYAPTELSQAKKALLRAEQAYQDEGDKEITRTLAYIAQRRAKAAMAQGKVNYLVTTREAKQQELFARSEAVREQYQEELVRQRQATEMTAQQLERQREMLEQQRQQLRQQGLTDEQQQLRERQFEAAIQRLEVEIERRQKAEAQLEQAMSQLADIATVRQEDGRGQVITLDNSVLFEVGKSELLPNARQRLKQVADVLQMQEERTITIEGHTDAQGSDALNQRLSRERAESVKDYLVSRGVAANRIRTVGFGEDRPIATNRTASGRAMNRRVEIVLPTAVGGGPDQQDQEQMEEDEQIEQDMDMDEQIEQQEQMEEDEQIEQDMDMDEQIEQDMDEQEPAEDTMEEPAEEPTYEDFGE